MFCTEVMEGDVVRFFQLLSSQLFINSDLSSAIPLAFSYFFTFPLSHAMDPLSITASVLTLLVFVGQVGNRCYDFYEAYQDAVNIMLQIAWDIDNSKEALREFKEGVTTVAEDVFSEHVKSRIRCLGLRGDELFNHLLRLMDQIMVLDVKPHRGIKWAVKGDRKSAELRKVIEKFNGTTDRVRRSVQT